MLNKVSFTRYLKFSSNPKNISPLLGSLCLFIINTERNQCYTYIMLSSKVESQEFKPFKDASEDYANK